MNQSTSPVQYLIQPPSVPDFLSHRAFHVAQLVAWAKAEHQRWVIYCSSRGYYRYLKVLNEEYSPIRFLAELHGFRKICAKLQTSEREWNKLSRADRKFVAHAFSLRETLLSD